MTMKNNWHVYEGGTWREGREGDEGNPDVRAEVWEGAVSPGDISMPPKMAAWHRVRGQLSIPQLKPLRTVMEEAGRAVKEEDEALARKRQSEEKAKAAREAKEREQREEDKEVGEAMQNILPLGGDAEDLGRYLRVFVRAIKRAWEES
jgi:hypothetical protein